MLFKDIFLQKYRRAREGARNGDTKETLEALKDLSETLGRQYEAKNGDPGIVKLRLQVMRDKINVLIKTVNVSGLYNKTVQNFFGLKSDEIAVPSDKGTTFGGMSSTPKSGDSGLGSGIDADSIASLIGDSPETSKETDDPVDVQPVEVDEEQPSDTAVANVVPIEPTEVENPEGTDEPTEANGSAEIEDGKPSYNPDSLRSFIGQQHVVRPLAKEIAIAKKEGRKHIDNVLLFGNPGLGKTTLMELVAKELGVRFELLDCSQFRNSQQSLKALQNFFMRIARNDEPVVIGLDEIHALNADLQSSLLTLLNSRKYVSPLDDSGQNVEIPIKDFTFIGATTDDDKVLDTIKNRCIRLTFQLKDYSPEELKEIYKNKISARGLTADEEAINMCIPRSRGAIRYVNSIVEGLNSTLYTDDGERISTHIDVETANKYFKEKGIDELGLVEKDREILKVIQESTSGISPEVISARVGLDVKKYLSEYERYLLKSGLIVVSGKGRCLTEKAVNHLKNKD